MTFGDVINVAYTILLDQLLADVQAQRQALILAAVFTGKEPDLPDPGEVERAWAVHLAEPLPVFDPATVDLKRALGLTS